MTCREYTRAVRLLPTCAGVLITLAWSAIAFADGSGVIATSTGDRARVGAAMADAMTGRARRVVADAVTDARSAVTAGAVPVVATERFKRVKDLVDEGWNAYLRVAVEVAALKLANARTEAEPLVALPGGPEVYADAALRLGIVLSHLGRKQEATTVYALALALDPDRPITKVEFAPDVVDAIDALRQQAPVAGRLHVASSPAGARIAIDGKDVGTAPLDIDVPRGQHVVVAKLADHAPAVQGVIVADGIPEVSLVLDPDRELVRLGATADLSLAAQQELVDATMRYADLDEIVLVNETSRRGGQALLAQRCVGIPAKCSAVVDIGFEVGGLAAAARSAWDAVRSGELRYPPTVLGERSGIKVSGSRCQVCRSPWLWSGVGAALLLGTIVTVVVTSSSRPPPIVGIDPSQYLPR
jgi:PEGA domain